MYTIRLFLLSLLLIISCNKEETPIVTEILHNNKIRNSSNNSKSMKPDKKNNINDFKGLGLKIKSLIYRLQSEDENITISSYKQIISYGKQIIPFFLLC